MDKAVKLTEIQHNSLLDELYLAPFETQGWESFLSTLVHHTASRSARILVLNKKANQVLSSTQINTDDKAHQAYVEHYVNLCPWRPELEKKSPGRLYSTRLDFSCDQKDFYRSEFFNDWARPLDIHHGACGTVWQHGDLTIQLLIQRTGSQGHFSHHDMQTINGLLPHVRRALRIEAMQGKKHYQKNADEQHHGNAMLLTDMKKRVVYISNEAEKYCQDGADFYITNGVISLRKKEKQQLFEKLLTDTVSRLINSAGGVIPIERVNKPNLHLFVMPIHPDTRHSALFPITAHAAVFITEVEEERYIDRELLSQLFTLTPAESRTAAAVARGMNPSDIACQYNLSIHTVRSQLKSVFRKTGANSQAQITNLVLNSPATQRTSPP